MDTSKKEDTRSILSHWHNFRLNLLIQGIVVGAASGFLIVLYRITLEKAEALRNYILDLPIEKHRLIPLWLLLLLIFALVVSYLIKKEPLIKGSGIPQVEGQLLMKIKTNWLSVMVLKFIGGVISIGAGLSLGREGPSIQLGAAVGQGIGKIFKREKIEERYLITSGASAGLAAAFNAPLAGVMFSLEEVHRHFSPLILLSAMSAALTSDFISSQFFGLKPVFNFSNVNPLPLESYGFIIILGIIVGAFGALYNFTLVKTQLIFRKLKGIPQNFAPIIPFLAAGILAFTLPEVLGGGHSLIELLTKQTFSIKMLLLILLVKFLFSMISYGSGAPGGIFFPLLILGALTGAVYGKALVNFLDFDPAYIDNFMILAMAGYFTAIVRAPITGSILITEMTGSLSHLLSLSMISLVAYIVADLLKSEPIYESLLENLLKTNVSSLFKGKKNRKTILEIPVFADSKMDGKEIKALRLPKNCLLVAIKRGDSEIIPNGNTSLHSGDILHVLVDEYKACNVKEYFSEMGMKPRETY